jgi:hypothetical protein
MGQCYLCEDFLQKEQIPHTMTFELGGKKDIGVQTKFTDDNGEPTGLCAQCVAYLLANIAKTIAVHDSPSKSVKTIQ